MRASRLDSANRRRSASARDASSDGSEINFGLRGESVTGGGRRCEDLAGVHTDTIVSCLASSELRTAAWRAPLRGVDWTAPHPAINKLAEREQPRDEPFNSATFCSPPPLRATSSPLAIASTPPPSVPPPPSLLDDSSAVLQPLLSAIQHVHFHSVPQRR